MELVKAESPPRSKSKGFSKNLLVDEEDIDDYEEKEERKERIRKEKADEDEDEEAALEKFIFGSGLGDPKRFLNEDDDDQEEKKKKKKTKKQAWVDDDDQTMVKDALATATKYPKKVTEQDLYRTHLVERFNDIYGRPKWVEKAEERDPDDSDEDDTDLLGYAGDLKVKGPRLPKGHLEYAKCANLTKQETMKSIIASVQFHPISNLALVAGQNGQVNIFQVDGDTNAKMQSIYFENFSLSRARFSVDGNQLMAGSKAALGYFYTYDLIKGETVRVPLLRAKERLPLKGLVLSPDGKYIASRGRNGNFYLYTMKTKEIIGTFKLNEEAHGLCFTVDSQKLLANGDEGAVYVFDVRQSQRCFHRFIDDGALGGRSILLSPNQGYLATGDQSGLLNIYKYQDALKECHPKPLKSLSNIITPVESLKFNKTSEMMMMSSGFKDNSVKAIHYPSLTVFPDFPRSNVVYKRITEVDISPNSGYITMANNMGSAFLFRLNHYIDY